MLRSMTGFGRGRFQNDSREYIVEIKSVNNRYSDISIKMPKSISFLEENVKKMITTAISRGKVEVFITFINNSEKGKSIQINRELAKIYIDEMKKLSAETDVSCNINITDIFKMPDVLTTSLNEDDEELIASELSKCTENAINAFVQMRETEGQKIKEDLQKRINYISDKIDKISSISLGLVKEYIDKLEKRVNELLKPNVVDEARLAQEVVIYSDKCSVEEEITRMKSHIAQFIHLLDEDKSNGKRIDFLIQEMNRETNTIGSKANNLEITNHVVDIKTEIENIREQIQNIE